MNALQDISVLVGTGCSTAIVVSANPGPIPDLQAQLKGRQVLQVLAADGIQHASASVSLAMCAAMYLAKQ